MLINNWGDWYWMVGNNASPYASARNIYVPTSDAAYQAWQEANGGADATPIPTEEEIWYYLKDVKPWWLYDATAKTMSQPGINQYTIPQLANYNSDARVRKVNGGMVAAGVPVETDDRSRQFIADAARQAQADPTFTTKWFGSDGNFYNVTNAQLIEMSATVNNHTNQCYLTFDVANDDILAGTLKTIADIDARYTGF